MFKSLRVLPLIATYLLVGSCQTPLKFKTEDLQEHITYFPIVNGKYAELTFSTGEIYRIDKSFLKDSVDNMLEKFMIKEVDALNFALHENTSVYHRGLIGKKMYNLLTDVDINGNGELTKFEFLALFLRPDGQRIANDAQNLSTWIHDNILRYEK